MAASKPPAWTNRNLIVCDGGPWDGWWYFTEDFQTIRVSAEAMLAAGQQGIYPALDYEATTQKREHPQHPAFGTVARHVGGAA